MSSALPERARRSCVLVRSSRTVIVPLLLLCSPVVHASESVLIEAAKNADAKALSAKLQRGDEDVNAAEPDGTTALHWAAHRADPAAVAMLLKAGARVSAANRYGVTPLSLACTTGDPRVIGLLLEAGADPNTALAGGETALMTAARAGNVEVVRLLLARGANVNAQETTRGQTALMWAAAEGHADVVRLFLKNGANLHAVSHGPPKPEAAAGDSAYRSVVPRQDRFTAFQFAVQAGHIDVVGALVEAGQDVNATTPDGTSALVIAVTNRHYELAAALLDRGADPNAAKQGWAALHQLARTRALNIGVFPHPVATGRLSSMDLARTLLAGGADVNQRMTKPIVDGFRGGLTSTGVTPLLLAAKGADAEMLRLLAEHGADSLAKTSTGSTALMLAAGVDMFQPNEDSGTNEEALQAVNVVLGLEYELEAANGAGETALHGAAYRGSNEIVKLLVDRGARLDVRTKRGFTPLMYANGEAGQVSNIQRRPETIALLRQLMLDRGLTPEMKSEEELYSFGVKVK